jgi:hypothetical protein
MPYEHVSHEYEIQPVPVLSVQKIKVAQIKADDLTQMILKLKCPSPRLKQPEIKPLINVADLLKGRESLKKSASLKK